MRVVVSLVLGWALCLDVSAQEQVWVPIENGFELSATLWKADGNPVGMALLVHGCLKDQREFGELPRALYEAGYDVVTYDLYSHGVSRTPRIEIVSRETHDAVLGRVSEDAKRVIGFFERRAGGVEELVLVASGCTGAWLSDLIGESQVLSRVVLFSGPLGPDAEQYLRERGDVAVFGISAEDDVERMRVALQRSVEGSGLEESVLFVVSSGGHGAAGILRDHEERVLERVVGWLSESSVAR